MSPTLAIFQKDTRHLWRQIVLWIGVLAFSAIADPFADSYISLLMALAAAYLIVTVIHEEALPGDRQYWRTRPFRWHDLIRAKSLFIVAFINAAVFITHVAVLAANGISVIEHVSTLLWLQFFLTAMILLPTAVLGAVTNSLPQIMLFAFFGFVAMAFIEAPIVSFLLPAGYFQRVGHVWVNMLLVAAIAASAGIALLVLQYRNRRTLLTCIVFFAFALACRIEFHAQLRVPPSPAQRVTLDAASARTIPARSAVELRVHIDGIPAGVEPIAGKVRIRHITKISSQGGEAETLEASIHDFANGAGWLTLYESQKFFAPWTGGVPVLSYSGDLDILLFTQTRVFPVPIAQPVVIPGIGACSKRKADFGLVDIVCLTPLPRASLALESPHGRRQWIIDQVSHDSPIPANRTFGALEKFTTPLSLRPDELLAARLISGQLLGQRHLTFDLPNLQLDSPR